MCIFAYFDFYCPCDTLTDPWCVCIYIYICLCVCILNLITTYNLFTSVHLEIFILQPQTWGSRLFLMFIHIQQTIWHHNLHNSHFQSNWQKELSVNEVQCQWTFTWFLTWFFMTQLTMVITSTGIDFTISSHNDIVVVTTSNWKHTEEQNKKMNHKIYIN